MDKYIGRLLDNRYEILEIIGTGGMAVVYKARCHRLNRLVAIKILKDDYLQDEEFRRRFHSESQAVAMLSHPNIVSVYDVSSSIMADYIVMELIDGITLKQYMEKKGTLNWKETLHFGIQIAKALEHAHSRGIVHRDIKPHNVMVLKNGSVKVMDFGIARMMSQGNTLTKEALGSVHYISPEQAKGGRVDSRSDIYSLGVVMYEMMAGRPPYDGDSPVSVAIQHINGGAVLPSTLNPNIPGGLEQIIMKAMAHEIADRYVSATRMLSDMDEFRKNPSLLFDYNVPPLDAVTKMPPPLVLHTPAKTSTEAKTGSESQRIPVAGTGAPTSAAERAARRAAQRKAEEAGNKRRTREQESQRRREETSSRATTIAIIVCVAVILFALIVTIVFALPGGFSKKNSLVTVPNLLGKDFDQVDLNDLQIKKIEEYNLTIPAGEIFDQKPAPGESVKKGTTLTVKVSLGAGSAEVINFADMHVDDAKKYLESLGLDLNVVTEGYEQNHPTVAEGKVIKSDPPVGETLTVGQKIILYVSLGPADEPMPNVVGKTQEEAQKMLQDVEERLKLDIKYEKVFDSEVEKGKVVSTDPEAYTQLKASQSIKVMVSDGPELKEFPDVLGKKPLEAVQILNKSGFKTWKCEGEESSDAVVLEQPYPAGTMVDVTEEIVLKIGVKEVTKNVTIDLTDLILPDDATMIEVYRSDVEKPKYSGTVPAEGKLVLKDEVGKGSVKYTVVIGGSTVKTHEEKFS